MSVATTEKQVKRLTRRVSAGDRQRQILFQGVRSLKEKGVRDQRRIRRLEDEGFLGWVRSVILQHDVEILEDRVTALEHRPHAFEILAGFAVMFLGLAAVIAAIALLIGALGFYKSATRDTAAQPVVVATAPAGSGTAEAGKGINPAPATQAPASGSVMVQKGDTLWDIFVSRLGRMPSWDELIRYADAHGLSHWIDEAGRLIVIIYPGQTLADLPR